MDPLSITSGVLSVLSSLLSLSIKINDVREDFQEAESEIQQLMTEVDTLNLALKQIEQAESRGAIPSSLRDGLRKILQQLNITVVETELFLKSSMTSRLRGASWAFSGKKRSNQLCRRLESYKITLNITMTSCIIHQGHNMGDEMLKGINRINRLLGKQSEGRDYILERYLGELETVYEGSSIAVAQTIIEENGGYEARIPPPSWKTPAGLNASSSILPHPPIHSTLLPSQSIDLPHANTTTNQPPQDPDETPGPNAQGTRRTWDIWTSSKKNAKPDHTLFLEVFHPYKNIKLSARGESFAVVLRPEDDSHYGTLFWGTPNSELSIQLLSSTEFDPDPHQNYWRREVVCLEHDDAGRVVAVLRADGRQHKGYTIAREDVEIKQMKRLPPSLETDCSIYFGYREALSPNARYFACTDMGKDHDKRVSIVDLKGEPFSVMHIPMPFSQVCQKIVWSRNSQQLLLCIQSEEPEPGILEKLLTVGSNERIGSRSIEIFNASNGHRLHQVTLEELVFDSFLHPRDLHFWFSGQDRNILVLGNKYSDGYSPVSAKLRVLKTLGLSDFRKRFHGDLRKISYGTPFTGIIGLDTKTLKLGFFGRDRLGIYDNPRFSTDGSCLLAVGLIDWEGQIGRHLNLHDSASGKYHNFEKHGCKRCQDNPMHSVCPSISPVASGYKSLSSYNYIFNDEGNRIYIAQEVLDSAGEEPISAFARALDHSGGVDAHLFRISIWIADKS
ncbi:hypothetical protein AA313_de0206136 [Arthrobotrys entomopaga]|nr:hypothetical protein AA313_de0206136 [Arthrobotrys entomopaga]